jgi:hypothetical protein
MFSVQNMTNTLKESIGVKLDDNIERITEEKLSFCTKLKVSKEIEKFIIFSIE